jgi:molybdopterin synthase catalytic subunit
MITDIQILQQPLDVATCARAVISADSGGTDLFVGTVRNATKGRAVLRLEFEAYEAMALSELRKLAEAAALQWPLHAVLMHHRVGVLLPGETAVIIAVSAAHRDAAFDACRYLIDTLKQTVPIWKKEVFADGEEWVSAHP